MANIKSTFAVKFIAQKGKLKTNGKAPILARITINGGMAHFSTKLDIEPDRWLANEGRTVGITTEEKEINRLLLDLHLTIRSKYNERASQGEIVTASKLKGIMTATDDRTYTLLELCDKFIDEYYGQVLTNQVTRTTFQRYVLTRNRLEEFIQSKYKQTDYLLCDINYDFIKGFDMHNRLNHQCANNTAARFVKHFRTMFNDALYNGWIHNDPFGRYKIRLEKVDRGFLTDKELAIIQNHDFKNPRLAVVKDMFLFSCYTGLAYVDTRNLTVDNVVEELDGTVWLSIARQKTKNLCNIFLYDVPKQIIQKYKGQAKNRRLLPIPSNQKTNDYLKEIATLCGINKNLTFHIARHTFSTTVSLQNGMSIEALQEVLGHNSIKSTKIYGRMVKDRIKSEMSRIAVTVNQPLQLPV